MLSVTIKDMTLSLFDSWLLEVFFGRHLGFSVTHEDWSTLDDDADWFVVGHERQDKDGGYFENSYVYRRIGSYYVT